MTKQRHDEIREAISDLRDHCLGQGECKDCICHDFCGQSEAWEQGDMYRIFPSHFNFLDED